MQALMLVLQAFKDNNRQNTAGEHRWVIISREGSAVTCDLNIPVDPHASIHANYQFASVTLLTGDNASLSPILAVFLKKQLKKRVSLATLGTKAEMLQLFHYEGKRKPWIACDSIHSVSTLIYRLLNEANQINQRTQTLDQRLVEAITLMRNNTEEPLPPKELAFHLGVSRRQLERLFRKHLDTTPAKYYLNIRLWQAKKLLQTTKRLVIQISVTCGFANAAHFSRAYMQCFGIPPSKEKNYQPPVADAGQAD